MTSTHRVILNMAALYGRVVVTTVLGLFTSRLVLAALGVVDFGLYSVIVGIMGFMAFLNGAMATSSSRHLTHSLGRGDLTVVNRIFKTAFLLHAALALILIFLGESIGLWFLNHVLNIPDARRDAAFWIYQFTIFSTACYVISVPYQALLTAHEALAAVSVFGIIQASLGFLLAIGIVYMPGDHLVAFVFFSSVIAIAMTFAQMLLCRFRYPESRMFTGHRVNRSLAVELLGFSGWSLVGSLSVVARTQGVAFLLNIFFGPVVNAAYGIANQMASMMVSLTQALQQSVSPVLIKQEGAGNRQRMIDHSLLTSKYGFFIACFWGIPLFAEMPTLLTLWLKNPPAYAVSFCRIILIIFAADQISSGFGIVVAAIGRVAWYQLVIGSIQLMALPLAYAALRNGCEPGAALYCVLFIMIVASCARGMMVSRLTGFEYLRWVRSVACRGAFGVFPAMAFAAFVLLAFPPSLVRLIGLSITTGLVSAVGMYLLGMNSIERSRINGVVRAAKALALAA